MNRLANLPTFQVTLKPCRPLRQGGKRPRRLGTSSPGSVGTKAMRRPSVQASERSRSLAQRATKLPSASSGLGLEENLEPRSQGAGTNLEPRSPAAKWPNVPRNQGPAPGLKPRRLGTKGRGATSFQAARDSMFPCAWAASNPGIKLPSGQVFKDSRRETRTPNASASGVATGRRAGGCRSIPPASFFRAGAPSRRRGRRNFSGLLKFFVDEGMVQGIMNAWYQAFHWL
jgi:hypothetical protein